MKNIKVEKFKKYGIKEFIKLFKKYNKFFKIYPKEQIKEILKENVQDIDLESYDDLSNAQYDFINKIIFLMKTDIEKPPITLKELKRDVNYIKEKFMHEIMHAVLLKVTKNKNITKYIESTFEYTKKDDIEAEIGRGMSEGLTEWLLSKAYRLKEKNFNLNSINITSKSFYYPIETNIISQLEILYGEDQILQIIKNGRSELEKIFKGDFEKAIHFLTNLDDITTFNNIIAKLRSKKEKLKESYDKGESKKEIIKKYYTNSTNIKNLSPRDLFKKINEDLEKRINENIVGNLRPTVYKTQKIIDELLLEQLKEINPNTICEEAREVLIKSKKIKNLLPDFGNIPGDQNSYSFYYDFAHHFQSLQEIYQIEDEDIQENYEKSLIQKQKENIIDKIKAFLLKQGIIKEKALTLKNSNQLDMKPRYNIREKYFSQVKNTNLNPNTNTNQTKMNLGENQNIEEK